MVIFVHGGEWTRGDKAAVSYKPKFFNEHQVVFASINYRLTPPEVHPAHVDDVAAAIAWVCGHAGEFGGDGKKIVLLGHSAGCHLVTLVALDPRPLAKVGLKPADLAGVVAWSGGAYDLVDKVAQGGSYADYVKKTFGESEAGWRDASPVHYTDNAKSGPAFLFVSLEPGHPSTLAAERMIKRIEEAGGKASGKMLTGRDHFGANHYLGARTTPRATCCWNSSARQPGVSELTEFTRNDFAVEQILAGRRGGNCRTTNVSRLEMPVSWPNLDRPPDCLRNARWGGADERDGCESAPLDPSKEANYLLARERTALMIGAAGRVKV